MRCLLQANTRKIILDYLAVMDGRPEIAEVKPWAVLAGLQIGNDDNVNSATSATSYLGFDLSENIVKSLGQVQVNDTVTNIGLVCGQGLN